jgi:hypothetical protein
VSWSCSGDRRGIGVDGCHGFLGETDRAGLVRYANSSTNLTVLLLTVSTSSAHARVPLKHGRHTRVVSCRTIAPGRISCAPLLFCSRIPSPQLARAWPVALHTHTSAESSRAGHWQNTSARTRERAGSIPLGPPGPVTPLPFPSAVTPSGQVYHRRRSCAARRTRAALLLSRPPHKRRELAVPDSTVAPSNSSHPVAAFPSGSPRHNRPSASARAVVCLHQGRAFRCLLLDGLRRPPRAAPLLPCESAHSCRTAALPAPRVTSLHTDPVAA